MSECSVTGVFWWFNVNGTETQIEISVKMQLHCRDSPEGAKKPKILSMLLTSLGNFLLCSELIFSILCLHC